MYINGICERWDDLFCTKHINLKILNIQLNIIYHEIFI